MSALVQCFTGIGIGISAALYHTLDMHSQCNIQIETYEIASDTGIGIGIGMSIGAEG